jgi:RimJ/RimL family protein N-acetyltransferase
MKKLQIFTKKNGFEAYGIQKNYLKIDNTYFDHKMMQIFKSQYLIS